MGVVGAALRGFGKALSKKGSGKAIKSVPIAKRLTERRKDTESIFKIRQDAGAKPFKGTAKHVKDVAAYNTRFDKAVAARNKKFKSLCCFNNFINNNVQHIYFWYVIYKYKCIL